MRRIMTYLFGVIVLALATDPAMAQPHCGTHDDIVSILTREYSESRQGIGLGDNGRVFELFVSPHGTWTVLVTLPKGLTCMVATGRSWESIPAKIVKADPTV